jgi:hypothetical protein
MSTSESDSPRRRAEPEDQRPPHNSVVTLVHGGLLGDYVSAEERASLTFNGSASTRTAFAATASMPVAASPPLSQPPSPLPCQLQAPRPASHAPRRGRPRPGHCGRRSAVSRINPRPDSRLPALNRAYTGPPSGETTVRFYLRHDIGRGPGI